MSMRTMDVLVGGVEDWKKHDEENGTRVYEKILERHRDINVDHEWWDFLIGNVKDFFVALGFCGHEEIDIRFTGFWSQGDGASFTTSRFCLVGCIKAHEKWEKVLAESPWLPTEDCGECFLKKDKGCDQCRNGRVTLKLPDLPRHARLIADVGDDVVFEVDRRSMHNYVHESTCELVVVNGPSGRSTPMVFKEIEDFAERIEEWRRDVCHAIYRDLEREHEYLTSEESVLETLKCNEYEFNEDGDIV